MSDSLIPPTPEAKEYISEERAFPDIFHHDDPYTLFKLWMGEATDTEINDPNAMSVATVDTDGLPDVRMLLLKGIDPEGFVFYTNENSAKGQHLRTSHKAALCFHWKTLKRSVRVRGQAVRVSDAEADDYFAKRARGSQIGAWASLQSSPLESRAVLESRIAALEKKFEGRDIPRPENWYGWRVQPTWIEFWRDRPFRLHDRLQFEKISAPESALDEGKRSQASKIWNKERLYP